MSGPGCGESNPLVRDGVPQNRRRPEALHPRRARVDDRGLADLLLFSGRHAQGLQYWNSRNEADGDFAAFVTRDVCYLIAEIAEHGADGLRDARAAALAAIDNPAATATYLDQVGAHNLLFNACFNEICTINRWLRTAGGELAVAEALKRQIGGVLRQSLAQALGLYAGLVDAGLLAAQAAVAVDELDAAQSAALAGVEWRSTELAGIWFATGAEPLRLDDALAVTTPIALDGADAVQRIRAAAAGLAPAVEQLAEALAQLAADAPGWLYESLYQQADHAPQMALWLAFARLFRHAQALLNRNTGRHLDYYYQQVLQMPRRAAVGDRVHLVFSLARKVDSHLLQAGTLLRAGKDAEGRELQYRLLADTALNRGALAEPTDLRSLFVDKADGYRLYAAGVAASADGAGADFPDGAEPRWRPLGRTQRAAAGGYLPVAARSMAFAESGFAVSSPELLLAEGERTIELSFDPAINDQPDPGVTAAQLRIRWTGAKGWEEADAAVLTDLGDQTARFKPVGSGAQRRLLLRIRLGAEQPPMVGYLAKTHGPGYQAPYPVLEVLFANHESLVETAYGLLREIDLTGLEIGVSVRGARALVLQNDNGLLDAAKPFRPFGPQPLKGASFYVGSDEAFRKSLTELTLHWQWQNPSLPVETVSADWAVLSGNAFESGRNFNLFVKDTASGPSDDERSYWSGTLDLVPLGLTAARSRLWAEPALQAFGVRSNWGFLCLKLAATGSDADPFGHLRYPREYAEVVVHNAKPTTVNPTPLPDPPWTPVMLDLRLAYRSRVSLDLTSAQTAEDVFHHVLPFGRRVAPNVDGLTSLAPRLTHDGDAEDPDSSGELYLGISGLKPRQNLSLLVQVADGSADPEIPQPALRWWYWGADGWRLFSSEQRLRDDTGGLIRSGLVVLDVPKDAATDPGLLPAGRHWLRITSNGDPRGLCDLISITCQAGEAELVAADQHPAHLAVPLPAGSISGLRNKQAAIKSVSQPYASFGGRQAEADNAYNTRVAERLRHKDRAIAIWDYERLVLEAFPSIYKVKCINHSTYVYEDERFSIPQSEFAPGWVSVVVIPDQRNRNAVNPLEPRASLATLDAIRGFLVERMTPWAARRLRVLNPLYERVSVDCKVGFVAGADFSIHRNRLIEDIKRFLSPWAFPDQGGAEISFGGTLHASTLLHYVEKRDYVDFVTDFQVLQSSGDAPPQPVQRVLPSSARSLFASAADHSVGEASC